MGRGSEQAPPYRTATTETAPGSYLPWWAWLLLGLIIVVLAVALHAQAPEQKNPADPAPAPKVAAQPEAPKTIKVKPESALRIRDAQVALLDLNLKLERMQTELQQRQAALTQSVADAYKDAGLKEADWDIDPTSWQFRAKSPPKP